MKIGISYWCSNIARDLNRDTGGWGIFGFFFPSIALIIISIQKKIIYKNNYFNMSDIDKSIVNNNLACNYLKEKNYQVALKFADKSINLNSSNYAAYDTRAFIKKTMKNFNESMTDYNKSIELNPNNPILYLHRGSLFFEMNNKDKAIDDWKIASEKGSKEATNFINHYTNKNI